MHLRRKRVPRRVGIAAVLTAILVVGLGSVAQAWVGSG